MSVRSVEITENGRGGALSYREGDHTAEFGWEFGGASTLALIFGVSAQHWALRYPWAADRQAEIYDFVSAEVVRQKAPGHPCTIDLASGVIAVM